MLPFSNAENCVIHSNLLLPWLQGSSKNIFIHLQQFSQPRFFSIIIPPCDLIITCSYYYTLRFWEFYCCSFQQLCVLKILFFFIIILFEHRLNIISVDINLDMKSHLWRLKIYMSRAHLTTSESESLGAGLKYIYIYIF